MLGCSFVLCVHSIGDAYVVVGGLSFMNDPSQPGNCVLNPDLAQRYLLGVFM